MWSLFPSERRKTEMTSTPAETDPFRTLQRRMDRLFDDFAGDYHWPFTNGRGAMTPTIDVSETDKEVKVEAELPGVDEKDIDVTLTDNMLTIKGEKKQEKEEKKDFHLTERSYGSFSRSMALPFDADPAKIKAAFKDGLLTITLPKPPEVKAKVKKIAIGKAG
ncbi:MAG: Hsp20/alpha crystallin family protein [Geminicoccaceae bacterium]